MKMKDEKQKHNHKLTDLIKICIFGLLMVAPLLASISQMLYVTLNKNAKDSYYGQNINEKQLNNINIDNLKINNYYLFNNDLIPIQTSANISSNIIVNGITTEVSSQFTFELNDVKKLNIRTASDFNTYIIFYDVDDNILGSKNLTTTIVNFNFTCEGLSLGTNYSYYNFLYEITYNKYSYLDNAFYYGVNQMTESDLFNWTQNTAIYTGVKAMTDNLQIQTPAIAILIVYWFILTIIYVIIDIVLKCFTTITHMIFRAD